MPIVGIVTRRLRPVWTGAILCLSACATAPVTPFVAPGCPMPPGKRGYPVSTHGANGALPTEFLNRVAKAVGAYVPNWPAMHQDRVLPPPPDLLDIIGQMKEGLPLERGDWTPRTGDTASVAVVYRRGAAKPTVRLGTGDSLLAISRRVLYAVLRARDSVTGHSGLPLQAPLPEGDDSTTVTIGFGIEPVPEDGVIRFAVQERAPKPLYTLGIDYPSLALYTSQEGEVIASFIVEADGSVAPHSVRLDAANPAFANAVTKAAPKWRFAPAVLDCRPVPSLVRMPIHFRMAPARPRSP